MVLHIAIDAGGLGFDSESGQIKHSIANISLPLRSFFRAVLPRRSAAEVNPLHLFHASAQCRKSNEDLIFLHNRCNVCRLFPVLSASSDEVVNWNEFRGLFHLLRRSAGKARHRWTLASNIARECTIGEWMRC